MKRFLPLAAIVIALLIILFVVGRCTSSGSANYQTATVTRGPITQLVTATGTLNPVTNVQVGSQVSGNIQKLFADFNSEVKAGQTVAQIDPALFQAAVTQAEGDLTTAQAALELAKVNAARTQKLFTEKNSSQQDVDSAMATLHQAEGNVKIKQGALDKAKADLEHCTITSPVDGVVISRNVDVGQTVAASLQAPVIFQIANDLTKMQIDAAVAEADVGGVVEGQEVEFTVDAYPTRTFHGKVTQVRNSPTTVNNVVTYDAVICVTNSDYKLKPGMTANVSIIIAQRDNAMKIPNAALRYRPPDSAVLLTNELVNLPSATNAPAGGKSHSKGRGNTRTVYFVAGDERAPALKPVQVKIGITDGIATEIIDGLKEGDKVVSGSTGGDAQNSASSNPFGGGFPRMR